MEETWSVTSEFAGGEDAEEMTHQGLYVYVAQNEYGENTYWYPKKESFLDSFGFAGVEPFCEFTNPDESERLVFYYDEETEEGCGAG